MCSIGEDDFGDDGGVHGMVPDQNGLKSISEEDIVGICKKCNVENVLIYKAPFRDFECRDCFLANARHKFRATLGSSKILPRNARVLLVFDGTAESVVLLDMLHHAQTQNTFKRMHCKVRLIYIDESILSYQEESVEQNLLNLQDYFKNYAAFESYVISISAKDKPRIYKMENINPYIVEKTAEEEIFFKEISAIHSLTSRQDFIKYHRNSLIAKAAAQLECPFAFLPDISPSLATQLLTSIALGRGSSAAHDVTLVDERLSENVKLIRPLRDLNQPEVDLYMKVQKLKPFRSIADIYGVNCGDTASLQNLTRAFVDNLQQNYSATVSTVFRACDKIAPSNVLVEPLESMTIADDERKLTRENCILCGSLLDSFSTNTLLAIEFSKLVSERGFTSTNSQELDAVARDNLKHMNDTTPLCHSCRNIEKDCDLKLFDLKN